MTRSVGFIRKLPFVSRARGLLQKDWSNTHISPFASTPPLTCGLLPQAGSNLRHTV
jgi:hypothetical protein